ncbi:cation diffusion facilitator family transporter [Demequina aurantiaca]|uniref:cation diffusion facilitator family transporter n=1 Tax=Demequina aurantiaca TaxID=676200 RepID=UPI000785F9DB|nr:cation diffusion facilitator family transporter [Demequina aurantiaca]
MSGSHSHTGHAGSRHRWRLAVSFGLILAFFVVELISAITSGSLALLTDAGHMAADVVALGAALIATRVATRPDSTGTRSYGSYRAEVFASGLAVLLMWGVSIYVVVEAIGRIGDEPELASGTMLVVGALGLIVNLVALVLLRGGSKESLNVKGAYLEVFADALGSVGVIAAGILVHATGDGVWDTVIALAIGVFVAVRATMLGREVVHVLAQHAPANADPRQIDSDLMSIDGVEGVHDLHVWTLTSGMDVATAHLVARHDADPTAVLGAARTLLRETYSLAHATIQVEYAKDASCHEADW